MPTNEKTEQKQKTKEELAREYEQMLNTPIPEDEARAAIAELDLRAAQLAAMRHEAMCQVQSIDFQLSKIALDRAIVIRRTYVKPADGQESESGEGA